MWLLYSRVCAAQFAYDVKGRRPCLGGFSWVKQRPTEEEVEEEVEVVVRFRLQELVVFLRQSTKVKRRRKFLINVFSRVFATDFIRATSVNRAAPQRIHFSPDPVFILCKYR